MMVVMHKILFRFSLVVVLAFLSACLSERGKECTSDIDCSDGYFCNADVGSCDLTLNQSDAGVGDGDGEGLFHAGVVLVLGLDSYAEGGVGFVIEACRCADGAVGVEGEK